ncbi:hypothetical protein F8E02_07605 [Methanoculleus sp. Wushi-C6]|uniref:DUF5666 domain-containing protein n=1 Tax=Methanoculleus caldifontis TaxID=2651577 RepID=A0ABU3X1F4_9EURY|nr:hypothetical protein [Methanoculleus sp. Wushi-C6]MDV2481875.1 hypothetical protein [Methanoculleus sp. Wushi-C6]
MSRYILFLVAAVIAAGIAVPAACAAGQENPFRVDDYRTVLQVQTGDATLGRITSFDTGGSVYVCREARIIPAAVGETLLHGDMISVQPGSFVRLTLVDRPGETLLEGGTDGLAVFVERYTGDDGSLSRVVERYLPESVIPSWRLISGLLDDVLAGVNDYLVSNGSATEEITTAIEVFR